MQLEHVRKEGLYGLDLPNMRNGKSVFRESMSGLRKGEGSG